MKERDNVPLSGWFFLLFAASAAMGSGFLSLESNPGGAEVWYSRPEDPQKKYLGDTPLEGRELPAGRYDIWLILPGHDTLALSEVVIVEGQQTQITREIPTHYNSLEITTDPDSAELRLDSVHIGSSPYSNNLLLPGKYVLKAIPREAHFRTSVRKLTVAKGDSVRVDIRSPYRDKSFLTENLSLPPWRLQLEAGLQFRSVTGFYDSAGKGRKFPNSGKRTQWDYPVGARLGLPQGLEAHVLVPLKSFDDKDSLGLAPFPSNALLGLKYTYRPLNLGLDATYGLGIQNSESALNHDFLALSLSAMASKGRIVGSAQAAFQFHFTDKDSNQLDPGDQAHAYVRVGYWADPVLPYLAVSGRFRLDGDDDGKSLGDGGYVLIPEPGLILDVNDLLSFQVGIPFTVAGKGKGGGTGENNYWGIHASMSVGIRLE